jgi:hypothetical protein
MRARPKGKGEKGSAEELACQKEVEGGGDPTDVSLGQVGLVA